MNYELKDKISVSEEFLTELETKCWQEIEHIQAQITNLAEGSTNDKLRQLFKNLLTSYYVFTGGIETLISEPINSSWVSEAETTPEEVIINSEPELIINEPEVVASEDSFSSLETSDNYEISEPFEYFVDFDEPIGDPITDEDLYN